MRRLKGKATEYLFSELFGPWKPSHELDSSAEQQQHRKHAQRAGHGREARARRQGRPRRAEVAAALRAAVCKRSDAAAAAPAAPPFGDARLHVRRPPRGRRRPAQAEGAGREDGKVAGNFGVGGPHGSPLGVGRHLLRLPLKPVEHLVEVRVRGFHLSCKRDGS